MRPSPPAARQRPSKGTIEGRPRLVDGDSFFIGHTEVRMQGIDAPEGRQTCTRDGRDWRCGDEARRTLERFLGGQPIRCDIHSTDQHGRSLATCFNASGANLNARMVTEGYAVAFGAYRNEEAEARSARRGLWASEFERPQEWRRRNNPAETCPACTPGAAIRPGRLPSPDRAVTSGTERTAERSVFCAVRGFKGATCNSL